MRLAFLSIGRHIHTERWIRWFAARGHECHLLTVQPGPVEGVEVHDITTTRGPKPLRYALSLARVRRILGDLRPDLLNTHFLTGYGYWGHFSGFHPNVLTVWGDDVYVTPFENRLKNLLARRALAGCDALTGDSADILALAATLGADPGRSYRVLWGVDFDVFAPHDARQWRRGHGFGDEEILYFSPRSYTQPYYNIDVVIEAAARVLQSEPRARFLFTGYEGDPACFREHAERAGLADAMVMLGRLPHAEFATALAACDVFISVPSVDATAVSLLEAMSCGTGIIVSALASAQEFVADGRSALVVPPRDEDALVEAMLGFARDPDLAGRLGAAALTDARRQVGFDTNMAYVDRIFRSLADGADDWPAEVGLPALGEGSAVMLSVVIPTYQKRDLLARTLEALAAQDAGPGRAWETVVVDDGSTDGTAELLADLAGRSGPPLRIVAPGRNVGRARARNLGARAATGRWLLFLDDDIVAPPGLLAAHLDLLEAHPGQGTVGWAITDDGVRDAPHFHYLDTRGVAKLPPGPAPARFFVTQNAAVPREEFLAAGGFDEEFGTYGFEDMEMAFRLEDRTGMRFRALTSPVPAHVHHHTLDQYLDKKIECGRTSLGQLARLHPRRLEEMRLVHVLPVPGADGGLLGAVVRTVADGPLAGLLRRLLESWPEDRDHRPRLAGTYLRLMDLLVLCCFREGLVRSSGTAN